MRMCHTTHIVVTAPRASLSTCAPSLSSSQPSPQRRRHSHNDTGGFTVLNHCLEAYTCCLSHGPPGRLFSMGQARVESCGSCSFQATPLPWLLPRPLQGGLLFRSHFQQDNCLSSSVLATPASHAALCHWPLSRLLLAAAASQCVSSRCCIHWAACQVTCRAMRL